MVVYAHYPLGETRVQREAEALLDAGFDVDVICLRGEGEAKWERHHGVEVHRVPLALEKRSLARQLLGYLRFFALATARLTALDRRRSYDSVQVHNLPDFLVFCAIVPKRRGAAVILDLHDLMPEFFAGRFGSGRHRSIAWLVRAQERVACRFADHVITVSDHWRDALIARGVRPESCSVVMNVADERVFAPRAAAPPADGTFRLVYHGTVAHRYGLDLTLHAVAALRDSIPGLSLTIIGRGEQMATLFDLRRSLGLQEQVVLRNELIPIEEIPAVLATAHVGVVPYRDDVFTDGLLPTKLMEYAAFGLPCIAARTTAVDRYFRDTMVEFFAPDDTQDLARCVRRLHADPRRLRELASGSENFTQRYSWRRIGAEYVKLVTDLGTRSN
jgi:glycosyltransferase involved in cell wall biosynthesis